ncbi:hypothetical protein PG994_014716 [Apiospora phragmitis]|uniref:Uncharacterized protein n=1 Tax=Apiospora phragmitis TaxID=2905665 RepID=A0ABR1SUF4_9PEZI
MECPLAPTDEEIPTSDLGSESSFWYSERAGRTHANHAAACLAVHEAHERPAGVMAHQQHVALAPARCSRPTRCGSRARATARPGRGASLPFS